MTKQGAGSEAVLRRTSGLVTFSTATAKPEVSLRYTSGYLGFY